MAKKKLWILLALTASLGMTGCSEENPSDKTNPPAVQQEDTNDKETPDKEEEDSEGEDVKEPEEDSNGEDVKEPAKSKVSVAIYTVGEDESIVTEMVEYDELNEKNIWQSLKDAGVVSAESEVLSLTKKDGKLELDVNSDFGGLLRSMGTAGETYILHCVVNTYLDAYECDEIKITEEGGILESGHAEYDSYMKRFEEK